MEHSKFLMRSCVLYKQAGCQSMLVTCRHGYYILLCTLLSGHLLILYRLKYEEFLSTYVQVYLTSGFVISQGVTNNANMNPLLWRFVLWPIFFKTYELF